MTATTTAPGDAHGQGAGGVAHAEHHETPEQRHRKEHLALWLFIGGDAVFLLLELFTWFYLRGLNTHGMWRGAACTAASPCTDGLGNPLTRGVPTADAWYTVGIAALAVVAALCVWTAERSARNGDDRSVVGGASAFALALLLAGIAVQCYQFGVLPFTTIDGTYASSFEFFMGSTLAHLVLLGVVVFGVWNRARIGRYDGGRWHQIRLVRIFAVWIAASVCMLAIVMSLFT